MRGLLLLVALVGSALAGQQVLQPDPFPATERSGIFDSEAPGTPLSRYVAFLERNRRTASRLDDLFSHLDANGDGVLDREELREARSRGQLSPHEYHLLLSFDTDGSGEVSWSEFRLGPLFFSALERSGQLAKQFREKAEQDAPDIPDLRRLYAPLLRGEVPAHLDTAPSRRRRAHRTASPSPAAASLLQTSATLTSSLPIAAVQQRAGERLPAPAEILAQLEQAAARHRQQPEQRSAEALLEAGAAAGHTAQLQHGQQQQQQQQFIGNLLGAVTNVASTVAGQQSQTLTKEEEKKQQSLPQSKFGVPSLNDERCVMCQYAMQRVQYNLFRTLSGDVLEGVDEQPGSALYQEPEPSRIRLVNAKLMHRTGGKGLLRIVWEETMAELCSPDNMPELFYQYCDAIYGAKRPLLEALFFQYSADAACDEAGLCGPASYFSKPSSVHLPDASKRFNSGRGKAGMAGGIHDRTSGDGLSSVLTSVNKLLVK